MDGFDELQSKDQERILHALQEGHVDPSDIPETQITNEQREADKQAKKETQAAERQVQKETKAVDRAADREAKNAARTPAAKKKPEPKKNTQKEKEAEEQVHRELDGQGEEGVKPAPAKRGRLRKVPKTEEMGEQGEE